MKTDYWKNIVALQFFVKLKMFQQEDNKEQDISIIDSSIAKDSFSTILKLLISWLAGFFLHIFVCFGVANMIFFFFLTGIHPMQG